MGRIWGEVALVLAAGFIPGLPSPLIAMLAVASVLRWLRGSSWGEAGLGGSAVFGDTALGVLVGIAAYVVVTALVGSDALGELAVVRGSGETFVMVATLSAALAAASEMVFRGFVMTALAKATDSWALANTLAAIAFGIVVGGDDLGAVAGLTIAGLGYGLLYIGAGRRLALPIAVHASFAVSAVVAAYLQLG